MQVHNEIIDLTQFFDWVLAAACAAGIGLITALVALRRQSLELTRTRAEQSLLRSLDRARLRVT